MIQATASAKVLQILLWYDQPEIVLLKKEPFEYILGVSSAHADNDESLFVGASMTLGRVVDYAAGKFDLRYALAHANLRRYWLFSFEGAEQTVQLTRLIKSSDIVASSLPDSGFFSREHHKIDLVGHRVPDTEEQFSIDGGWELGEFSKFYGQVEDIYYIFNDIELFESPNTPVSTKQTIVKAFDRSWGGGGSYVAFYDKIANDNSHVAPLKVSGIKYNSPGYVAIKAKKNSFDNMIALLQAYADHGPEARKSYSSLNRLMSFAGLLKPENESLELTDVIREEVDRYSRSLEALMPGVHFDSLLAMTRGNLVVAAKVLMSVFRRTVKLYDFFEQGRVKYTGLETDPLADDDGDRVET